MNAVKLIILCLLFSCNDSNTKADSQESKVKDKSSPKIGQYNLISETRKNLEDDKWNNNIYTTPTINLKSNFQMIGNLITELQKIR